MVPAIINSNASTTAFQLGQLTLSFHSENGALEGFQYNGINFVAPAGTPRPLFVLQFRDENGEPVPVSSLDLGLPQFAQSDGGVTISFDATQSMGVQAKLTVSPGVGAAETNWSIYVEHEREGFLESVELPRLVVPNNLIGTGGDATILWPAVEGVLVEDIALRASSYFAYRGTEYPNSGWGGYYPSVVSMQLLAYTTQGHSLYFAAHDPTHATKEVEYLGDEDGVRLIMRSYVNAIPAGRFELPYPIVLGVVEGDWHAAAERYRDWATSGSVSLPPAIRNRQDLPNWTADSPVVVTYPVTGTGHHAGPTQPNEYFPFPQALPAIDNIAGQIDSRLLVLLMHWEGTAPWSPPYVWPPLGGEAGLREFTDAVHAKGNLVGLYCSGLAWTNRSQTGHGTYNRQEEFDRDNLIRHMCRGPKGEYTCLVCVGEDIRYGYDICAATEFAQEVVSEEAAKIAAADIDYIQLFDQNFGGAAYHCYDTAHGHAAAPGAWQAAAMGDVLLSVRDTLEQGGRSQVIIGTEGASAEPFLDDLPMNDLRYHMAFGSGRPVPAYSYVYHEYGCNFMGNQVDAMAILDQVKDPWNLALRYAYSFAAGDLLTIVLKDHGQIHWAWCCRWNVEGPDQDTHLEFIRHLNSWRKGFGKPYLYGGRMLTPWMVETEEHLTLTLRSGWTLDYPAVLTSKWQSEDGSVAQFLVNYTDRPQRVTLCGTLEDIALFDNPESGRPATVDQLTDGTISLTVPPLSAIMISPNP